MRSAIACATIVLLASVLLTGCSGDGSDEGTPAATTTESIAPASTLPTSETVKLAIFERAYTECASTELKALAAKYKLRNTTTDVLATGVGQAWVQYFKGGQDAFMDGRQGCLAGLRDRNK